MLSELSVRRRVHESVRLHCTSISSKFSWLESNICKGNFPFKYLCRSRKTAPTPVLANHVASPRNKRMIHQTLPSPSFLLSSRAKLALNPRLDVLSINSQRKAERFNPLAIISHDRYEDVSQMAANRGRWRVRNTKILFTGV
jgi:hypothetical protein